MDSESTGSAQSEPVTRLLEFDGCTALVSTFDHTMTVNWTPNSGPRDFAVAVSKVFGWPSVGVMVQRLGEPFSDLGSVQMQTYDDYEEFGIDNSVRFLRIDMSDTLTAAWQRVDPDTVFAGLGDSVAELDVERLRLLLDMTAAESIDIGGILDTVSVELSIAREDSDGPEGTVLSTGI